MIRKSYIIHRDKFFDIALDERVSKVEIANSYNKTLRDKSLCKIYVYYKLTYDEWMSITNMLKKCDELSTLFDIEFGKKRMTKISSYLKGLQSCIRDGFISAKHCEKIEAISEQFNGYNFMIPKRLIKRVLDIKI